MIIGLSGYATCGKDSVADVLVRDHGFVKYAWADMLRLAVQALDPIVDVELVHTEDSDVVHFVRYNDALERHGYNQAKARFPEFRRVLQYMGTEVGRNLIDDNVWVDATVSRINRETTEGDNVVITDTRFLNEAAAIERLGGAVVRVTRPEVGAANAHPSEVSLDDYDFDYYIHNDGDLNTLSVRVAEFMDNLS